MPTVGVFSADAVAESATVAEAALAVGAEDSGGEAAALAVGADGSGAAAVALAVGADGSGGAGGELVPAASTDAVSRRYERGVVFYLRERRVVGVLLWNLFNRMHVARQVGAAR